MKNIYALPYKITKILLIIITFLLTFAILQDFSDIITIIIGLCAVVIGVIHGTICNKYEIIQNHIKMIKSLESFTKFMEELSKESNNEEKS